MKRDNRFFIMENYDKLESYLKSLYPDKYEGKVIVDGKWVKVRRTHKTSCVSSGQSQYRSVREAVLERDNHTCQKCGQHDDLHVHHIKHRADGGSNEADNLVTLCDRCHAEEHKGEPIYKLMVSRFNA